MHPTWHTAREIIDRAKVRALQRLRGELNVDRLIAQGEPLDRSTHSKAMVNSSRPANLCPTATANCATPDALSRDIR